MVEMDTIAAIATPSGNAGIGIIRISGKDSVACADQIIRSKSGRTLNLAEQKSHTVHYGFLFDGEECIDEVLVTILLAPRSYTAENTVEISCHGGMYVLKKALEAVLKTGIRLAKPGEFTKRAFMNGRIDLTEAESVMKLISSQNEFSRNNSIRQLKGSLYERVCGMRKTILHETAFIEAALDDPEHYKLDGYTNILKKRISDLYDQINDLIESSKGAQYLLSGIKTVILGKPNAGKSTLLNLFAGYEKAIVTSEEGTTRDFVEEKISIGEIILRLIDTAGIRHSDNEAEKIGVSRSKKLAKEADLILLVLDSSRLLDETDKELLSFIHDKRSIILLNKSDLTPMIHEKDLHPMINAPVIPVSALKGEGKQEICDQIMEFFLQNQLYDGEDIYITNIRQMECFQDTKKHLQFVMDGIRNGDSEDVLTIGLMDAYRALGNVIGESLDDDLADCIFSEFCMGK